MRKSSRCSRRRWPRCWPTAASGASSLIPIEREVERYGGATGVLLAEQLFHVDSEAAAAIIEQLDGDAGEDARWRLALRSIDMTLNELGFSLPIKQRIMRAIRDGFAQEFHVDNAMRKQLSDKFRPERKNLELLLDPAQDAASPLAVGLAILHERTRQAAPVIAVLQQRAAAGDLTLSLAELAPSLLHMQVNRLLRSAQRCPGIGFIRFSRPALHITTGPGARVRMIDDCNCQTTPLAFTAIPVRMMSMGSRHASCRF